MKVASVCLMAVAADPETMQCTSDVTEAGRVVITEPASVLQKGNFATPTRAIKKATALATTGTCEAFPSNWFTDYHIQSDFEAMLAGECVEFVNSCLQTQTEEWNNCNQWRRVWSVCADKWCCNAGDADQTWHCEKEVASQTKEGCPGDILDPEQMLAQNATIGSFCGSLAGWFSNQLTNPSWSQLQVEATMTEESKDNWAVASLVSQLQKRSISEQEATGTEFDESLQAKCVL